MEKDINQDNDIEILDLEILDFDDVPKQNIEPTITEVPVETLEFNNPIKMNEINTNEQIKESDINENNEVDINVENTFEDVEVSEQTSDNETIDETQLTENNIIDNISEGLENQTSFQSVEINETPEINMDVSLDYNANQFQSEESNVQNPNVSMEIDNVEMNTTVDNINETQQNVAATNMVESPITENVDTNNEMPQPEISPTLDELTNNIEQQVEINQEVMQQAEMNQTQPIDQNSMPEEHKKGSNKVSAKSIVVIVIFFLVLAGVIYALPMITDYFSEQQLKTPTTSNDVQNDDNQDNENDVALDFKSGIDVKEVLTRIKPSKNYEYQVLSDVYVKDKTNQTLTIKNHYTFSFNETKYKAEMNKIVAEFEYTTVDYYEKTNDIYTIYIDDITTKKYAKEETTQNKFNILYNIFDNTINYLINDYTLEKESPVTIDDKEYISMTLSTNIDILKNLSVETTRIQNKIDTKKLSVENVEVTLLVDKDYNLYEFELILEDKNAYEATSDQEVESVVLKHVFSKFNEITDIELPSL